MFRQWSTVVAGAVVAASLLLAPGTARAQYRYMLGGPGIYYTNPSASGAAGYNNPYFRRGPLGFGNIFSGGFGFPMWGGYGMGLGGYGMGLGGFGMGLGYGGYGGYNGSYITPWSYQPLTGITGYGSYYSPLNYSALPSATAYLYPSFGGYNPMYPNYIFTDSATTALTSSAYPMPLSSFPYTPRLNNAWHASPLRTTTGFPAVGPIIAPAVSTANQTTPIIPRIRQAMSPAVGVPAGSSLLQQSLGGNQTSTPTGKRPAFIKVILPTANAKVWFQGQPTTQTGKVRSFESPPLASDGHYAYEIRAQWTQDGEPVTLTRRISIQGGAHSEVDFRSKQD